MAQGCYNLLSVSLGYMLPCTGSFEVWVLCAKLTIPQSVMGSASRGHHDDTLPSPSSGSGRARAPNGALHLLDRPEYHSILFRGRHGLHIPLLLYSKGPEGPLDIPDPSHTLPPASGQHFLVAGVALWLRQPGAHRLSDIYPREILQTAPRHVPPPDDIPETIPPVQIRSRSPGDLGRCDVHPLPSRDKQEGGSVREDDQRPLSVRPVPSLHQPPPGRSYKHNAGSRLQLPTPLHPIHGSSDDGRAECPLHDPHHRLPPYNPLPLIRQPHPRPFPATDPPIHRYGALLRHRLPLAASAGVERRFGLRRLRRRGPGLHLLHPLAVLVAPARHGHRDAEDAHHAPERLLVRTHPDAGTVAGGFTRVWRGRCRGVGAEAGEEGEGEGQGGGSGKGCEEGLVDYVSSFGVFLGYVVFYYL